MCRDVESSLNQRFAFLGRFCESSLEVRVEDNGFDSFIESSLYLKIESHNIQRHISHIMHCMKITFNVFEVK